MTEHYLDRLARTINENWNSPALSDFYLTEDGSAQNTSRGNHYTYGEMYDEILHVCDIFQSLGLKQGDHIAICGANSAHWAIAYLAIAAYQGVAVTILHSQSPEDIAHQIDFSDAKALFTDSELWEKLQDQSLPQIESVINLENWQILRGKQIRIINHQSSISNQQCQFVHGSPNELAMICFTSGSTGVSKGIMIPFRAINNSVRHSTCTFSVLNNENANYLSILPLGHVFGLVYDLLSQICIGKYIHFVRSFSINDLSIYIEKILPYAISSPPMVILGILTKKGTSFFASISKYCRGIAIGGSEIPIEIERIQRECNIPLYYGYGLTETASVVSGEISYLYHRQGSCDRVIEGLVACIAPNGEILVKGENVMLGYYKDPEATARKIDRDGWLHTGDKGHLDEDGYLYVEGRLEQDMIVLPNGENIHPEDIERTINALPVVKESIVLARDGKLVAIVVPQITNDQLPMTNTDLRRIILRNVNPQLPLYSQLYDIEITDAPLQKTEKQTLKRYLYK